MSAEEKADCCPGASDCGCGTPAEDKQVCCDPAARAGGPGKIVVFILVIGGALAVLAYALIENSGAPAGADPGPAAAETSDAPAAGEVTLGSIASLRGKTADLDAALILLPGKDPPGEQRAADAMAGAIKTLRAKGKRVAAFTLDESDADHARLVENFPAASLPSIVALGKSGCGSKAVSGEITEAKLLCAFDAVSTPSGSCCPSTGK